MNEKIAGQILVADDDKVNRLIMGRYLEKQGHVVALASDGKEALDLLNARHFDLLLLDIEMPVLNGYQVLEHLVADPNLRDIPVIVTSGNEGIISVVRCIEMGAEDYLTKPVNQVLLKARIDASLEKKRLRDKQTTLLNRLEREMEIARETQLGILPETLPQYDTCEFGALMIPARTVGGDFYDVIDMGKSLWGLVVGDVSDKGMPAALFMTLTYSLLRAEASRASSPRQALINVNQFLMGMNKENMFVTIVCGILDCEKHQFTFARAGHPAPVVISGEGEVKNASVGAGQALGLFTDPKIEEGIIELSPDSLVLLYSDGLSEAMNAQGKQFGTEGLIKVIKAQRERSPQEICQSLWDAVRNHYGDSPQQDDFTVLAFKGKGCQV